KGDRPMSLRIGVVASRGMRDGDGAPLLRFMRDFEPFLVGQLGAELHVPGATADALSAAGLLAGYGGLRRLPPASQGGIITLTAQVVGLGPGDAGLDWVIFLLDPTDPTALYPETQALKRQCVVHGKPFLGNLAAASEWCALEWHRRLDGRPVPPALAALLREWVRPGTIGTETVALIAHDRLKPEMLRFAATHRALLSRFARRLATGTTGGLLNAEALAPGWVESLLSGPRGGDAQIAEAVLLGQCRRAMFFEDPHVAREHEADIQLLERATRFAAHGCLCLGSREAAERWAENLAGVLAPGSGFA
ncbi:MAG TPA: methylglyoxal synthase, partial [Acetobacteraceae bacterium]